MAFWDTAWDAITGAFDVKDVNGATSNGWLTEVGNWMDNHKNATNILGNALAGVGSYYAQNQANKDLMRQQRELLNMQDALKSQYSAVPDADSSYKNLTVDNAPGLANGGILTEMKKDIDRKHKGV